MECAAAWCCTARHSVDFLFSAEDVKDLVKGFSVKIRFLILNLQSKRFGLFDAGNLPKYVIRRSLLSGRQRLASSDPDWVQEALTAGGAVWGWLGRLGFGFCEH